MLVTQSRFRQDLFYRINAVTLRVPALSERKEDIPILAEHFLQSLRTAGSSTRALSLEAKAVLCAYSWPGNVRELHNVIERVVLMGTGTGAISSEEVKAILPAMTGDSPAGQRLPSSLEDVERLHIQRILEASGGNKTQAAKALDIDYKTLLTKLKKYDLTS